ncbi:MAG: ComEA family DNA-binding protein [bacterium]
MLGFTKQEQGIVLFLIFTLLIGSLVTLYNRFITRDTIPNVNPLMVEEFKKRAEEINDTEVNHYSNLNKSFENPTQNNYAIYRQDSHTTNLQKIKSSKSVGTHTLKNGKENNFLININKASQEELQNIPRLGPVLAKRIINYRQKNGQFESLEELKEVNGIGTATLKKIEPYIVLK